VVFNEGRCTYSADYGGGYATRKGHEKGCSPSNNQTKKKNREGKEIQRGRGGLLRGVWRESGSRSNLKCELTDIEKASPLKGIGEYV